MTSFGVSQSETSIENQASRSETSFGVSQSKTSENSSNLRAAV